MIPCAGHRHLRGDIFTDSYCWPAKCDIPNARGVGPNCECADHHTGTIRWEGPTPVGMCERMGCMGQNSNGLSGPDCGCKTGFVGAVKPMRAEHKHVLFANCTPAPCHIRQGSNGIPGPHCGCKDGYAGSPRWNAELKVYVGECSGAACDITNSNKQPGLDCRCNSGYTGHISWIGLKAFGECVPMPCVGDNTNGVKGPGCRCSDGFTGSVVEANHTVRIDDEWEDEGWTEKSYEALVGHCEPAPCNVQNSNRLFGLICKCLPGYTGKLTWAGAKVFGACTLLPCVGKNLNRMAGPQCRCVNGFRGSVRAKNITDKGWNEKHLRILAITTSSKPRSP